MDGGNWIRCSLGIVASRLATSIDATVVGVGLTTLLMMTLGISPGRKLGSFAGKRADIIGGLMLIATGASISYGHLTA